MTICFGIIRTEKIKKCPQKPSWQATGLLKTVYGHKLKTTHCDDCKTQILEDLDTVSAIFRKNVRWQKIPDKVTVKS